MLFLHSERRVYEAVGDSTVVIAQYTRIFLLVQAEVARRAGTPLADDAAPRSRIIRIDALGGAVHVGNDPGQVTIEELGHVYHGVITMGERRKFIGDGDLKRIVEGVRTGGRPSAVSG